MEINKNEHATMIALMTNDKGLKINDMKSCHFPSAEQLRWSGHGLAVNSLKIILKLRRFLSNSRREGIILSDSDESCWKCYGLQCIFPLFSLQFDPLWESSIFHLVSLFCGIITSYPFGFNLHIGNLVLLNFANAFWISRKCNVYCRWGVIKMSDKSRKNEMNRGKSLFVVAPQIMDGHLFLPSQSSHTHRK